MVFLAPDDVWTTVTWEPLDLDCPSVEYLLQTVHAGVWAAGREHVPRPPRAGIPRAHEMELASALEFLAATAREHLMASAAPLLVTGTSPADALCFARRLG